MRGTSQGLAFVPCTANSALRKGAEAALTTRFPTWSGSSRPIHARRKRGTTEGVSLAGTFEKPTTSKPLMQTKLWGGWSGKEPAEETAETRGTPAMLTT